MVEVLGPSCHKRENFPPEIDVYKVPHSRMKELVTSVEQILPQIEESIEFRQTALEATLQLVYSIIWELKTHEIIENTVIMQKLRERMHSRQVYNQSVCNCHEDSELLSIIDLVESIYSSLDKTSRTFYWQRLQGEIYQFLEDFDQHMEEEESIFQPLLNQYFNYEELVQIKDTVMAQHSEWKSRVEAEKSLKNLKRGRVDGDWLVEEVPQKSARAETPAQNLPKEVILEILGHVDDPRDLARASQVCQSWNECSRDASLWRRLSLSHWEFDIWRFHPVEPVDLPSHLRLTSDEEPQPCQLFDQLASSFLPTVGAGVHEISLVNSRISMAQLQEILQLVPNLRSLDLSYSSASAPALRSPNLHLPRLTKVDLSGCLFVTDDFVNQLVRIIGPKSQLEWLSLSGCEALTDSALLSLAPLVKKIKYFDCSGCFRFSGNALKVFTKSSKTLQPEFISYCNVIQDGPYPELANGCDNQDCDQLRSCCRNTKF